MTRLRRGRGAGAPLPPTESVTLDDIAVEPIPRLPDADWNAYWRIDPSACGTPAPGGPLINAVEDKLELIAAGQVVAIVSAGLRADSLHPDLTTIPLHGVEPSHVVLVTRTSDRSRLVAAFRKCAEESLTGPDSSGAKDMTGGRTGSAAARPDVIPSRHEDVWDYGGAAGPGPGPGQSVLR
jgi:hypothetical protein